MAFVVVFCKLQCNCYDCAFGRHIATMFVCYLIIITRIGRQYIMFIHLLHMSHIYESTEANVKLKSHMNLAIVLCWRIINYSGFCYECVANYLEIGVL